MGIYEELEQRVRVLETIVSTIANEVPPRQEKIDSLADAIRETIKGVEPSIALAAMFRVRNWLIAKESCRRQGGIAE